MAFTAVQEAQLKELLASFSSLENLVESEPSITDALAYGDVRVVDLNPAGALNPIDVFYCAQANADVKVTWQQMADYLSTLLTPVIEAAVSDAKFYYTGQF